MWEDKGSGSKWAVVNPYYLPHDLPDTVIQPSAAEDSEVSYDRVVYNGCRDCY